MHTRNMVFGFGVLVALVALSGSLVSAEPPDRDLPPQQGDAQLAESVEILGVADQQPYQYMVKYVCEGWASTLPYKMMAYGDYHTAINVHNYTDHPVRIYKRPSIGYTETENPAHYDVPVYAAKVHMIRPRKTLVINCEDITSLLGGAAGPITAEGFVQLSLAEKLPVAAVYTSSAFDLDDPADGYPDSGPSIDVEYIDPFLEP